MFTGNSRERLVQDCCYGYLINVHEIATMLQLEENVIDLIYVYWKLKRKVVGTRLSFGNLRAFKVPYNERHRHIFISKYMELSLTLEIFLKNATNYYNTGKY